MELAKCPHCGVELEKITMALDTELNWDPLMQAYKISHVSSNDETYCVDCNKPLPPEFVMNLYNLSKWG